MTARKVAGAYLALVFGIFMWKMVERNGIYDVAIVVGIVLALFSVVIAAMVVLVDY